MTPEQLRRVRKLVEKLLQIPPDDWQPFLDDACADDEEVRREVERQLQERTLAETSDISPTDLPTASAPAGRRKIGKSIGPYELIRVIGEGGMGIVYEAVQEKPIRRTVALKVIKHGVVSPQTLARFESERQVLALMNHPNIARVLEVGTDEDDCPYFAMEFIRGVPITDYCDRHNLTPDERMELMVQVCEGVQHAHQKGIIHRDLKPTNILVEIQGSKPVPRIIDFGVAKAMTDRAMTERSIFTEFGQIIGTPEYMSPEQAEMSGAGHRQPDGRLFARRAALRAAGRRTSVRLAHLRDARVTTRSGE